MRRSAVVTVAALAAATLAAVGWTGLGAVTRNSGPQALVVNRLAPVLPVDAIEPALPFWERLGFEASNHAYEGDHLGFVIFRNGDVEVMYQTHESLAGDLPPLAATPAGGTVLFIEVDDLDAVADALGDIESVVPRRRTAYGADEIIVREPGGNVVLFAEFPEGGD